MAHCTTVAAVAVHFNKFSTKRSDVGGDGGSDDGYPTVTRSMNIEHKGFLVVMAILHRPQQTSSLHSFSASASPINHLNYFIIKIIGLFSISFRFMTSGILRCLSFSGDGVW